MAACPMCGMTRTVDTSDGKFLSCLECGYSAKRLVVGWD